MEIRKCSGNAQERLSQLILVLESQADIGYQDGAGAEPEPKIGTVRIAFPWEPEAELEPSEPSLRHCNRNKNVELNRNDNKKTPPGHLGLVEPSASETGTVRTMPCTNHNRTEPGPRVFLVLCIFQGKTRKLVSIVEPPAKVRHTLSGDRCTYIKTEESSNGQEWPVGSFLLFPRQ